MAPVTRLETGGPAVPTAIVYCLATSSRCQRRMVSGVTSVAACATTWRPSRCPSSARRRRLVSLNRRRRPASRALRTRFSSRRNAMTSACSRWNQTAQGREQQLERKHRRRLRQDYQST